MKKTTIKTAVLKTNITLHFQLLVMALAVTFFTLGLGNFAKAENHNHKSDIVDLAAADPQFSTLVGLIKTAGLVDTLKGAGPFTVFAPTNDAFAKLPKDVLDGLAKDTTKLKAVLTYHVVSGKVLAKDAMNLTSADTVNGKKLEIKKVSDGAIPHLTIGGAKIVKTDIIGSNGVIHVIDTVLVP